MQSTEKQNVGRSVNSVFITGFGGLDKIKVITYGYYNFYRSTYLAYPFLKNYNMYIRGLRTGPQLTTYVCQGAGYLGQGNCIRQETPIDIYIQKLDVQLRCATHGSV